MFPTQYCEPAISPSPPIACIPNIIPDQSPKAEENPSSWFEKKFTNAVRARVIPYSRMIHGICEISPTYCLVEVPDHLPLKPYTRGSVQTADIKLDDLKLANNYSLPKAFVAVGQGLLGATTLYKTQGDQIAHYGVAAFGLTVAPYTFMSLVNLVSAMVTPEYGFCSGILFRSLSGLAIVFFFRGAGPFSTPRSILVFGVLPGG